MKIKEIIVNENLGHPRKGFGLASTGPSYYPDIGSNDPYGSYRFGIALAGSPDFKSDTMGPTGNRMVTTSYTDADEQKNVAAAKMMGVNKKRIGSIKSQELPAVNKKSPVVAQGPIKVKKPKR